MALDYGMLLNQPSAGQQIMQGINQFAAIREADAQAKIREQQAAAQQAAAERQGLFQQAFGQAFASGDRGQLSALIAQFPEQYEMIKGAVGLQNEQQAAAMGSLGVQLSNLATSNPQAAAQLIANNADVLRNAGPGYEPEMLMATLQENPQALAEQADKFSLLALGPEKYFDVMANREKLQAQLRGQDIQMRGQDIQQQEGALNRASAMNIKQLTLMDKALDREVTRLNSAINAETNDLKRQKLEVELAEKQQKLDAVKQETQLKKQSSIDNLMEAKRLAEEISKDDRLSSITGQIASRIPTVRGASQDLINKADRLQSLLTVDNLKLMTGVLTDRDIQFLVNVSSGLKITDEGIKGSVEGVQERLAEISEKINSKLQKQPAGGIQFLGFE